MHRSLPSPSAATETYIVRQVTRRVRSVRQALALQLLALGDFASVQDVRS
jgi:hypothetical protein